MPGFGLRGLLRRATLPTHLVALQEQREREWGLCTYNEIDGEESGSTTHETCSAPQLVDDLCRDDGSDDSNRIETACQTILCQLAVASLPKEYRRVGSHCRYSSPGSHNLEKDGEPRSPTKVRSLLRIQSEDHLEEFYGRTLRTIFGHGYDFVVLPLSLFVVGTSQTHEDLSGFFVSPD